MEKTTLLMVPYLSSLEIIWLVNTLEGLNPLPVPYENADNVWLSTAICNVRYRSSMIHEGKAFDVFLFIAHQFIYSMSYVRFYL